MTILEYDFELIKYVHLYKIGKIYIFAEIKILSTNLYRGKIELFIKTEQTESELPYNINIDLAEKYHNQIKKFQKKIGSTENIISTVFKFPDLIEKKKLLLNRNKFFIIFTKSLCK